jgi:hypothetical protein
MADGGMAVLDLRPAVGLYPPQPGRHHTRGRGEGKTVAAGDDDSRTVMVWDAPTRLFHWSAAGLVLAAWLTERLNWMQWHVGVGEALLAQTIGQGYRWLLPRPRLQATHDGELTRCRTC